MHYYTLLISTFYAGPKHYSVVTMGPLGLLKHGLSHWQRRRIRLGRRTAYGTRAGRSSGRRRRAVSIAGPFQRLRADREQLTPLSTQQGPQDLSGNYIFLLDFSGKSPHFSAKRKIFLQIHRNTPENSKVHPIRRRVRGTKTYPILETFLFLITTLRFGCVGALEGRKKVPDNIFLEIKKKTCFWWKIMESTLFFCKYVFLAEDYG